MEKLDILPQYIYKFTLPDNLLTDSISFASGLDYPLDTGQVVFDKKLLPQLAKFIEKSLDEVRISEHINFEYVKPHLMWANKKNLGQWHRRHTHPNSFLSGIIYLTTCDSRTWFSIPNLWCPQNDREYVIGTYPNTRDDAEIIHKQESIAGTMIVFPSHLPHSVDDNKTDTSRYTIAFNAFPCGKSLHNNDGSLAAINIQLI